MPGKYEFVAFDKSDEFTVTFGDDDLPTAIDGWDDKETEAVLAGAAWHPLDWWMYNYPKSHNITKVGAEEEETAASKFEVAKLDVDKRLVFGWAYVTHDEKGNVLVDKSGEFVDDVEELERAVYEFVIKSRRAGDMHREDFTAGTMVESIVLTPEKMAKMGIPPGTVKTGWWAGFRIEDDTVWQAVKNGERPAFSIHGKARKEPVNAP